MEVELEETQTQFPLEPSARWSSSLEVVVGEITASMSWNVPSSAAQ